MPPRKKRIKAIISDDSENSTVDSKGPSSGSDVQMSENLKHLRHQSKKVNPEDYDGDCELERNDRNRVKKIATRSRVLKQKTSNKFLSDGSSSTPVTQMDVDECFGFENLTTPVLYSPVPRYSLPVTPGSPLSPKAQSPPPSVMPSPKPLFETPIERPKKAKRKRVARVRQSRSSPTRQEAAMLVHFREVESHELLIE